MGEGLLLRIASLVDRASFGAFHTELERIKKSQREAAKGGDLMAQGWTKVKQAAIAYFSIAALKQMGQAALEQAKSLDLIRTKVEDQGASWSTAGAKVRQYSNSFTELGVGASQSLDVLNQFISDTEDLEGALALSTTAIKASVKAGRPLQETLSQMQSLLSGATAEMKGYGGEVAGIARVTGKSKEALIALAQSVEDFDGAADENVRTLSTFQAQISNVSADIGGPLITSFTQLLGQSGNLQDSFRKTAAFFISGVAPAFNFFRTIIDGITNQVATLVVGLGGIGRAVGLLFKGDFKGAWESAKDTAFEVRMSWNEEWDRTEKDSKERMNRINDSIEQLWTQSSKSAEEAGKKASDVINGMTIEDTLALKTASKERARLTSQLNLRIKELTMDEFDFRRAQLEKLVADWEKAGVAMTLIDRVAAAERKAIAADEADYKAQQRQEGLTKGLGLVRLQQEVESMLSEAHGAGIDERRQQALDQYEEQRAAAEGNKDLLEQIEMEHMRRMANLDVEEIQAERRRREEARQEKVDSARESFEEDQAMRDEEFEARAEQIQLFYESLLETVQYGSNEYKRIEAQRDADLDANDRKKKAAALKREAEHMRKILLFGRSFANARVQDDESLAQALNRAGRSAVADQIRTKLMPLAIAQAMTLPPPANFAMAAVVAAAMEVLAAKVEGGGGGGGGVAFAEPGGPTQFFPETGLAPTDTGQGSQEPPVQITVVTHDKEEAARLVARELDDIHYRSIRTRGA